MQDSWMRLVKIPVRYYVCFLPRPWDTAAQGRLKEHSAFWLNELESSSFVESMVLQGYQLPFIKLPDPVCLLNHRSAYENSAFVSTAIEELIAGWWVIQSESCPTVCSPLSVVLNAKGKQRLVADLRYINQFLPERKFKYEGLDLIPLLWWFLYHFRFKVWLSSCGYPPGYISAFPGQGRKCFVSCVSNPSGSPQHAVLLRPLIKRWRTKGLRCIVYTDDGIGVSHDKQQCITHPTKLIINDISSAGFVINVEKWACECWALAWFPYWPKERNVLCSRGKGVEINISNSLYYWWLAHASWLA